MTQVIPIDQIEGFTLEDVQQKQVTISCTILRASRPSITTLPNVTTTIRATRGDFERRVVIDTLWAIDSTEGKNSLPSKVWYDTEVDAFVLLYYTIPNVTPPMFSPNGDDDKIYCFALRVNPNETYTYDLRARVFIDQILVRGKMYSFFMFGAKDYQLLISGDSK